MPDLESPAGFVVQNRRSNQQQTRRRSVIHFVGYAICIWANRITPGYSKALQFSNRGRRNDGHICIQPRVLRINDKTLGVPEHTR